MSQPSQGRLDTVLRAYALDPARARLEEIRSGHINLTWRVLIDGRPTLLLQRINHFVFRTPVELMENVALVTRHIRRHLFTRGITDAARRCPELVPTDAGRDYLRDDEGWIWRAYRYIENTVTLHVPEPTRAEAAARAYGDFQLLLSDLDPSRLHVTIPRFHDTAWRIEQLETAAHDDRAGRRADVAAWVEEALSQRDLAHRIDPAALPRRVVHYDTKLTNVLFDASTGEPLCVVDLDTVMPGLVAHDFGDMVRTMAHGVPEDAPGGGGAAIDDELFAAVGRGYLASARRFLTAAERGTLYDGALQIVAEMAMRFLADHLDGDRYFRVAREGHNLDRALTQLHLLRSLRSREQELRSVLAGMG